MPLTVYVNGMPSAPVFVGAAKGMVAGITQVNVQVPTTTYSSNESSVSVNSAGAPLNVVK